MVQYLGQQVLRKGNLKMRTYTIIKRCDKCGEEVSISPARNVNTKDEFNRIKGVWAGAAYVEDGKPTLKELDLCRYCRTQFFGEFSDLMRRYGLSEFNDREEEYDEQDEQEIDDDW